MGLLTGLAQHILRTIFFMADGRGLPRGITPGFWLLALSFLAAAQLRHVWLGEMSFGPVLFGTIIMLIGSLRIISAERRLFVSIYLCASTGVDISSAVLTASGMQMQSGVLTAWELAAFAVAAWRSERREAREKQAAPVRGGRR